MQNLIPNDSVYTENPVNQEGFTYLSVLFSFTVLLTLLPFAGFVYQSVENKSYLEELAINQCFQFFQDEADLADKTHISPNSLAFTHYDGSTSSIGQYHTIIRRQVENQGHETLLRDVRQLRFDTEPYGFKIRIVTLSGREYENKIFLLSS